MQGSKCTQTGMKRKSVICFCFCFKVFFIFPILKSAFTRLGKQQNFTPRRGKIVTPHFGSALDFLFWKCFDYDFRLRQSMVVSNRFELHFRIFQSLEPFLLKQKLQISEIQRKLVLDVSLAYHTILNFFIFILFYFCK